MGSADDIGVDSTLGAFPLDGLSSLDLGDSASLEITLTDRWYYRRINISVFFFVEHAVIAIYIYIYSF